MKETRIVTFSSPYGVDKTSLTLYLLKTYQKFSFFISATTKKQGENETNGVNHNFLNTEEFKELVIEKRLIESEEVQDNIFYGTPFSEIERIHQMEQIPLLDISVKGAIEVKKKFGEDAINFFLTANEVDLERTIKEQSYDSEKTLAKRLAKADHEMLLASMNKQCFDFTFN